MASPKHTDDETTLLLREVFATLRDAGYYAERRDVHSCITVRRLIVAVPSSVANDFLAHEGP